MLVDRADDVPVEFRRSCFTNCCCTGKNCCAWLVADIMIGVVGTKYSYPRGDNGFSARIMGVWPPV